MGVILWVKVPSLP